MLQIQFFSKDKTENFKFLRSIVFDLQQNNYNRRVNNFSIEHRSFTLSIDISS